LLNPLWTKVLRNVISQKICLTRVLFFENLQQRTPVELFFSDQAGFKRTHYISAGQSGKICYSGAVKIFIEKTTCDIEVFVV